MIVFPRIISCYINKLTPTMELIHCCRLNKTPLPWRIFIILHWPLLHYCEKLYVNPHSSAERKQAPIVTLHTYIN